MKRMPTKNLTRLAVAATAMLVAASVIPFLAHAQTKYANDTFTLISRSDGGSVNMHAEGTGDHCWATTSDDRGIGIGIGISMGDSKCTMWVEGADDGASLRAKIEPTKITFRLDGKSYAVSDAATVKSARDLFGPLVSIQEQQSDLGAKQRALGEKQREFGRQQREVKVPVPDMSADFQRVEADAKRLSALGGTQSELGDLQSEIGDLESRLGDLQSQAGDIQSKLGDQQSALGDQQSALGDKQSALGDESEKIATDVAGKLRAMLTQAIQSGTAKAE
ncbi:MAG TPA: hypothetical protein VGR94_04095 [Candidatus Acidoferrales bacterium]|nr:hypothetical protein [Candidatus Acidoferrales bacterium]